MSAAGTTTTTAEPSTTGAGDALAVPPSPRRRQRAGLAACAAMIASLAGVAGYTIGSADGSAPTVEPAGPDSLAMVDEVCAPLTELAVELRDVGDAGTDAIELLGRVRDAVPAAEQVHVDILIETYTAVADGDVSSLADETTADTATLAATSLMTYFEAACGIDLATG